MHLHASRCDCCGSPGYGSENECLHCGYPMEFSREKAFLIGSIKNLTRVATHGGTKITVSDLISRYQSRLAYLVGLESQTQSSHPVAVGTRPIADSVPLAEEERPVLPVSLPQETSPVNEAVPLSVATVPQPAFSLHSFFADQSINIVASLGAFLILVGSLSFIATTPDLL